jgi:hypothetical protein
MNRLSGYGWMSYHLPFPGVGHVVRAGTAFNWLSSDWRWEVISPT